MQQLAFNIKQYHQNIGLRKNKLNPELETLFKSTEELKTYLTFHDQYDAEFEEKEGQL